MISVALVAVTATWGASELIPTSDARGPGAPAVEPVPGCDDAATTSEVAPSPTTSPEEEATPDAPPAGAGKSRRTRKPAPMEAPAAEMPLPPPGEPLEPTPPVRPSRVGRQEAPTPVEVKPPVPSRVGRQEAPTPVEVKPPVPSRVGRQEVPAPAPAEVKPPAPSRVGRQEVPAPAPKPTPAPKAARRVELTDITYRGNAPLEHEQRELFYQMAWTQFEALLPQLEACGRDTVRYDVNLDCTTKAEYWQQFRQVFVFLMSNGTIDKDLTNGCFRERLAGAPMPIGKTHPELWEVSYKVLRRFKPNPDGGALCPYKGLAE